MFKQGVIRLDIGFEINKLKADGKEQQGFILNRPNGTGDYVFIHFKSPVNLLQQGGLTRVAPGGCILYEPGSRHWFEAECGLFHDWVHFLPRELPEFQSLRLPVNLIFYPKGTEDVSRTILSCERNFMSRQLHWRQILSAELELMFLRLSSELAQGSQLLSGSYRDKLKDNFIRLRVGIYNNVGQDWNVAKMAAELSLSRSRFSVLYHEIFGVTPAADLIHARLERAKYLLQSTDEPVWQVAQLSGYGNLYHFLRQFKAQTGMTPSEFRASIAGVEQSLPQV